jgi:outer membrane protein, multidrug efflux system
MVFLKLLSEQSQTNRRFLIIFLILFSSSACTLHNVDEDATVPFEIPTSFKYGPDGQENERQTQAWWTQISDSRMQGLIKSALSQNYDIRKAWTRLSQTDALLSQTNAALFPEIVGNGDMTRSRSVAQQGAFGDQVFLNTRYNLNLSTSYEIDIWGKSLSLQRAAIGDRDASRFDVEATALTIAGQVAETWARILEQRSQIDLLQRQLKTNETFLELTELRFNQARNTAVDVLQQRQQVASSKTQIPLAQSRLLVLEHQLNLLRGQVPSAPVPRGAAFPRLNDVPKLGLPGDLLTMRPDVKAAQLRLVAADHRIAAKVAERLPALRLNASAGYQSFDLSTLFANMIASAGAGLTAPLFDAGRRKNAVEQQRFIAKERLQDFAQVTLTALKEVEDALGQERFQIRHITELEAQLGFARQALEKAKERYANGLSEYLLVLTSLQSVQRLEQSMFSAKRDRFLYRIQLYRALGGSWTRDLTMPDDLQNS